MRRSIGHTDVPPRPRLIFAAPQAEQIKANGITFHGESSCEKIELLPSGERRVTLGGAAGGVLVCDQVMFATGRAPNTRFLGLEKAGVQVGPMGNIIVDDFSKTTCDSIYAVGDVTNRKNLTPVATMEGMALAATLFKGQPTAPRYDNIATAVFTQPPIGSVGVTEEQAVAEMGARWAWRLEQRASPSIFISAMRSSAHVCD